MRTGDYSERDNLVEQACNFQTFAAWNHHVANGQRGNRHLSAASVQQAYASQNAAVARACLFALIDLKG